MSKNYTQLSLEQRYQIEVLVNVGLNQKEIAIQIGVHPSTISRELSRNIAKRGRTAGAYQAVNAQRKTDRRHSEKPKKIVFTTALKQQIAHLLTEEKWSPELISKRQNDMVSHEWIYQWIWECKHSGKRNNKKYKKLYRHLRHGRRRRKRGNRKDNRGLIPNRVSIEKRPAVVLKRKRPGDIEVDLMMGKDHKGALLVMTDRCTLDTHIEKLNGRESKEVSKAVIKGVQKKKYRVHTLTFDNDMAFCGHEQITKATGVATYFTRPYTSQDKGTVENRIGVLRRFFPKKTDLRLVSNEEVREVEMKINNRPIRKYNYLTANEVLQKKIALIT